MSQTCHFLKHLAFYVFYEHRFYGSYVAVCSVLLHIVLCLVNKTAAAAASSATVASTSGQKVGLFFCIFLCKRSTYLHVSMVAWCGLHFATSVAIFVKYFDQN